MSTLVDHALAAAGLQPIAEARRAGDLAGVRDLARILETADLLAVGALADRIRFEESGDVVRIFANVAADPGPDVVVVSLADGTKGGLAILRRVAIARIVGPKAARVRIDWEESGLEVAQVALGFGASELVGPIANRRGLPIADASTLKVKGAGMVSVQALKKKELESLLAIAGRRAVFAPAKAHVEEQVHV
jgi:2-iminoacetate synthase ThiH